MKSMSFAVSTAALFFSTIALAKEESLKVAPARSSVQWTGKKVVESAGVHTGKVAVKAGQVTLVDGKIKAGWIEMDMASITDEDLKDETYNKKLVGHLRSPDFFDVEKHPTAKLTLDKDELVKAGEHKITGTLTIKGKSKPVSFVASEKDGKGGKSAVAEFTFDRTDFDVRYGSGKFFEKLGDKMIADEVKLAVDIALETEAPKAAKK